MDYSKLKERLSMKRPFKVELEVDYAGGVVGSMEIVVRAIFKREAISRAEKLVKETLKVKVTKAHQITKGTFNKLQSKSHQK